MNNIITPYNLLANKKVIYYLFLFRYRCFTLQVHRNVHSRDITATAPLWDAGMLLQDPQQDLLLKRFPGKYGRRV